MKISLNKKKHKKKENQMISMEKKTQKNLGIKETNRLNFNIEIKHLWLWKESVKENLMKKMMMMNLVEINQVRLRKKKVNWI